jgi:hypothetical protein
VDKTSPAYPFDWNENLAGSVAIQACYNGVADEAQQRLAIETIAGALCGYYDLSFRENDRDTVFAEGKRWVGAQIVKLTKINYMTIRRARESS